MAHVRPKYRLKGGEGEDILAFSSIVRKRLRQKKTPRETRSRKKKAARTKLITAFRIGLYKGLIELPLFTFSLLAVDLFLPLSCFLSFALPAFAVNPNPI